MVVGFRSVSRFFSYPPTVMARTMARTMQNLEAQDLLPITKIVAVGTTTIGLHGHFEIEGVVTDINLGPITELELEIVHDLRAIRESDVRNRECRVWWTTARC